MGLFARFVCLRRDGTANDLAQTVRELLQARNVVETADPAATERLMMIAPAGDGWLMVVDRVQDLAVAMADPDGLLLDLSRAPGTMALDIIIADSDDLLLSLIDGSGPPAQLAIGRRGLQDGAPEPWQRLLVPGQSVENIRKAFARRTTLIEEHLSSLRPLFGIDLAAFADIGNALRGQPLRADTVLLRLKAVPAPGQTIGPPRLEVNEVQRQNFISNRSFPHIPRGLVTHFPAFGFESRGGGARGLELRLTGSALEDGLIEVVSAELLQQHPTDSKLNRDISVAPEVTATGVVVRFGDLEVPDWLEPDWGMAMRARVSLQDLRVWVYCRALKVGDGELKAQAHLVVPQSAPVETSYPVTVLPEMWRPIKGSEQPNLIQDVLSLNRPGRVNGLAVLRGGADAAVSALRRTLETWRSLIDPRGVFIVAAATEVDERTFFQPVDVPQSFKLDLSKKRQAKWDRLLADMSSIQKMRITSDFGVGRHGPPADYRQRYAARIVLHYVSAAAHTRLPEYAARLGHVSLSLPPDRSGEIALASLMEAFAREGLIGQAYVAAWDHDDDPSNTLYERAANIFVHQRPAQGWGTRYLRAVADRLWLGPEFVAMLSDRTALERVAIVSQIGDTLAIERRGDATLRDLEMCLEPLLPSQAESQAFWDRFGPRPSRRS